MTKKKKTDDKDNGTDAVRSKALEVAMDSLRKKFGDESISLLTDMKSRSYDIISTGSLSLDSALGVGGLVRGRLYEFYGPPAGGKSTLAYSTIREATNKGIQCLYIDVERTIDAKLLASMGVNTDLVRVVYGYTGEEYLDKTDAMMATGEFGICVIDSITALLPSAEAEQESYGDQSMGLLGRLTSKMCRNLIPLAGRTNTALIVINQLRETIGGYGNPEVTTGGKSIGFYSTSRIRVSGGKAKSSRILDPDSGFVSGHRVSFFIEKNKLAAPYRTCEVDLIYGKGYDTIGEILDLGVDMGFVDKGGAWYKYGEDKIQGRDAARNYFIKNTDKYAQLRVNVAKILGVNE